MIQTHFLIHEFSKVIPVLVKDEKGSLIEGYALYVESSGFMENDSWAVVLKKEGIVRHFNTSQIRIAKNATFEIK